MVDGYQGKPAAAPIAAFDPSPANIEAGTLRPTLANGMQLSLLPKPTRRQRERRAVPAHGRHGQPAGTGCRRRPDRRHAGARRGALDFRQVADRLGSQAGVSISGDAERVTVRFQTRRAYLPDLLALLRDVLRAPQFPASELETLRSRAIRDWKASSPSPARWRATPWHATATPTRRPRHTDTLEERISPPCGACASRPQGLPHPLLRRQPRPARAGRRLRSRRHQGQLATLFGDWSAPAPFTRVPRYLDIAPAAIVLRTPDKTSAVYVANLPVKLTTEDADYPLLLIANRVFGGASLKAGWPTGCASATASAMRSPACCASARWTMPAARAAGAICAAEPRQAASRGRRGTGAAGQDGITEEELAGPGTACCRRPRSATATMAHWPPTWPTSAIWAAPCWPPPNAREDPPGKCRGGQRGLARASRPGPADPGLRRRFPRPPRHRPGLDTTGPPRPAPPCSGSAAPRPEHGGVLVIGGIAIVRAPAGRPAPAAARNGAARTGLRHGRPARTRRRPRPRPGSPAPPAALLRFSTMCHARRRRAVQRPGVCGDRLVGPRLSSRAWPKGSTVQRSCQAMRASTNSARQPNRAGRTPGRLCAQEQHGVLVEQGGRVAHRAPTGLHAVARDGGRLQPIEQTLGGGKCSHTSALKKSCRLSRVGTAPVAWMCAS